MGGPVTVCAAVTGLRRPPPGLTDSKLLTVKRRTELAETLRTWVTSYALGHASPQEIDERGMTAALRLAAVRALEALPVRPDAVILDGKHDYLGSPWKVRTVIKGDQSCVAVAAASVLAKVQRDKMMAELGVDHADFAFAANVGYPSPVHRAALEVGGPPPTTGCRGRILMRCPSGGTSRRPVAGRTEAFRRSRASSASISDDSARTHVPPAGATRTGI